MRAVGEPLTRSRDLSRSQVTSSHVHFRRSSIILTRVPLFDMAYEDWNEIEGEDQDELQDASVGSRVARFTHALIHLSFSGSRVNVM